MKTTVTPFELVSILADATVSTIKMTTETKVQLKKACPLRGRNVTKVTTGSYLFGLGYKELVETAAGQEFNPQSLPWGEWVEGAEGKVIKQYGEYYVRTFNSVGIPETTYYVDGKPADKYQVEMIKDYQYKKSVPHTQQAVGLNEGTQIIVRNPAFSSIRELNIGPNSYQLAYF